MGVVLDSYSYDSNTYPYYGTKNSLDIHLNTNTFWSFVDYDHPNCTSTDEDNIGQPCGQRVMLGGISYSLRDAFPNEILQFSAKQFLSNGTLVASLTSSQGSAFSLTLIMDHKKNIVLITSSYISYGTDAKSISIDVNLWVEGKKIKRDSYSNPISIPAPYNSGCFFVKNETTAACASMTTMKADEEQILFVTRSAVTSEFNKTMPILGSLAAKFSKTASSYHVNNIDNLDLPRIVTAKINLSTNEVLSTFVSESESRGENVKDPYISAIEMVTKDDQSKIKSENDKFYKNFWSKSSINLPSRPLLEHLWYGALFNLASVQSTSEEDVCVGLYGPWGTDDNMRWHSDYTLDYNYEATFYGVHGIFFSHHNPSIFA